MPMHTALLAHSSKSTTTFTGDLLVRPAPGAGTGRSIPAPTASPGTRQPPADAPVGPVRGPPCRLRPAPWWPGWPVPRRPPPGRRLLLGPHRHHRPALPVDAVGQAFGPRELQPSSSTNARITWSNVLTSSFQTITAHGGSSPWRASRSSRGSVRTASVATATPGSGLVGGHHPHGEELGAPAVGLAEGRAGPRPPGARRPGPGPAGPPPRSAASPRRRWGWTRAPRPSSSTGCHRPSMEVAPAVGQLPAVALVAEPEVLQPHGLVPAERARRPRRSRSRPGGRSPRPGRRRPWRSPGRRGG